MSEIKTENRYEKKELSNIPNEAFDMEYRTQWRDEVDFLAEHGIYYTIRKREGEYGIPVYKYTKTADLFCVLTEFYLKRRRNARSKATFRGYEQQSFINRDGSINEKFAVKPEFLHKEPDDSLANSYKESIKKLEEVKQNKIDLEEIKKAKEVLEQAINSIGKEKLDLLTQEEKVPESNSDDTE